MARIELDADERAMFEQAKQLEKQASDLRSAAIESQRRRMKAMAVGERLVYAAHSRCPCGAGLAYDPCYEEKDSPFVGSLSNAWDCSAILLGTADRAVQHTGRLPFAFYDVKEEGQPSAYGATTRPKAEPATIPEQPPCT